MYRIQKLFSGFFVCFLLISNLVSAQLNLNHLITNPSFETNDYTGWTWTGRTGGWITVNSDGDGTKDGTYIGGYWNGTIGDCECSQKITGLPTGYYRVTALATVSNERTTNQRLFANNKSMLFGASSNPAYTPANLVVLGSNESYTFGGYSTVSTENGPFKKLSVVNKVTDGNLYFGFRFSGKGTALGYNFSYSSKGDAGFFKFDNFTLTEVSKAATLDNIQLSSGTINELFNPDSTSYTALFSAGTTTVTPMVVPGAEGQTIVGVEPVDVSSGSGISTIKVTSIDGTTTKTYTIRYTVLTTAKEAITSFLADSTGVTFQLAYGKMKLQVCTDKIIQVSYTSYSNLPVKDSIVVNRKWEKIAFSVADVDNMVTISTNSLIVKVNKANSLVSFFDATGKLIVSEDSKQTTPAIVLGNQTYTCATTFNSPITEGFYGLGQHQQKIMNYKGQTVTLDQQNTEIALPFLVTTGGYGLLWDNYSLTNFYGNLSLNTKYQFSSESGKMVDYYFMYGPELDEIIADYRIASGAAPLFPKWAYGLFQSKDKYASSVELLSIANQYRTAKIPLDCIVQDWDYWTPDYWGSHTMYSTKYPNPKALIDSLHNLNIHTMISIWPVFHSSTANYQAFNAINALYPSMGAHHFYDPHSDAAKKIYWNQVNQQLFSKYGWDSWWADNDEPQGYPDAFDRKSYRTAKGPGATYYNTYPIEHTSSVYNGWRKDIPEKRVFILSRSAFSGQQRYATAAWSGDISSTWGALQNQLSAGLNFCMSGMPYWTTDIGGYTYADWSLPANNELMIRWFQYGAFCPIFRIHGQGNKALVSTTSFPKTTVDNLTATDKLRYRLMPYIYSLAWKVTNEHYTMMRHLIMDYRTDVNVKSIDNQFLFGPSMLINPVTSAGVTQRPVYLPAGKWYDFWTGSQYVGGKSINANAPIERLPIFIKAGAILPMGPDIMYANQPVDSIEIRVYQGENGSFVLYEDAGDGYEYEKGKYMEIPFTYAESTKQLTIGVRKGGFDQMKAIRFFKVVFVDTKNGIGLNNPIIADSIVRYDGNEVIIKQSQLVNVKTTRNKEEFAVIQNSTNQITKAFFLSNVNGKGEMTIHDTLGKCFLKSSIVYKPGSNEYLINATKYHLLAGIYLVSLKTNAKTFTYKVDIQ
jgi:alpha-D-xyloside xylohydrolase